MLINKDPATAYSVSTEFPQTPPERTPASTAPSMYSSMGQRNIIGSAALGMAIPIVTIPRASRLKMVQNRFIFHRYP